MAQTFYMEYIKGKPYFYYATKKIKQYQYLNKDINCEILIVGGGMHRIHETTHHAELVVDNL